MADTGSKKPTRDVDDISLDDARPAKKSGGVALSLILLMICIASVWYIFGAQQKKAAEAKVAKEQREVNRQGSVDRAKANVQLASEAAAAGNLDEAIRKLNAADGLLGNLVSDANSAGDTDAASTLLAQKAPIAAALSALNGKKAELQAVADEQFGLLRTQFGLTAPAPAATETPAATTPDATAPPATGAEATPPAATTPPTDPPAVPAPAAAPAAPVVPVPAPAS